MPTFRAGTTATGTALEHPWPNGARGQTPFRSRTRRPQAVEEPHEPFAEDRAPTGIAPHRNAVEASAIFPHTSVITVSRQGRIRWAEPRIRKRRAACPQKRHLSVRSAPPATSDYGHRFRSLPRDAGKPVRNAGAAHCKAPPRGIATRILPTEWAECGALPNRLAGAQRVVMFGVAEGANRIRYERVSRPGSNERADAAGEVPNEGHRRSHRTRLDVDQLAQAARRKGFPVTVSENAGAYICNAAYGAALSTNPNTLFVHIPMPGKRGPTSMAALEAHAVWLLDALKAATARPARPRRAAAVTPRRRAPAAGKARPRANAPSSRRSRPASRLAGRSSA